MKINEMAISNTVFGIAGIVLGYLSFNLTQATQFPAYSLIILIISIFALKFILEKAAKIKQPKGWWFGNGIMLCIFAWFIVWTILMNVMIR